MSRRVVLTAAALAAVTTATIIDAGCTAPMPSSSPATVVPAAASVPTAIIKQAPANAVPNTNQASLVRVQSEGRSRFMLMRWQGSDAAPKELLPVENDDIDPAAQPISIEFSGSLEVASGVVSGYSGCNHFSGSYEKLASGTRFGNLVSTRMACDPTRVELETAFLEVFKSPLTTVDTQLPASDKQGRQVIWETTSGTLLQFTERSLPPCGQTH